MPMYSAENCRKNSFTALPHRGGIFLFKLVVSSFLVFATQANQAAAGPDACTETSTGVYTCSGDQSDGISSADVSDATEVDIKSLSGDIAPTAGTDGVDMSFSTSSDVTGFLLNYDALTSGEVSVSGDDAMGIAIVSDTKTSATREIQNWMNGTISTTGSTGADASNIAATASNGSGGDAGITGSGSSGKTGGTTGPVYVRGTGTAQTVGDDSSGVTVLLQSGKGGKGGNAGATGHGGKGGAAGIGGSIGLNTNNGDWTITTTGEASFGLNLSSVGGLGGSGGTGSTSHGGDGHTGGDGGAITLGDDSDGTLSITTQGDSSHGITILSQGGNGGNGGDGDFDTGGTGGQGAQGGDIIVENLEGTLSTSGDQASGMFVVSQAGSGGKGGSGREAGDGGSGGPGGGGGTINLGGDWAITTTGSQSNGVLAYSLGAAGGEGGDGGFFTPTGGSGGSTGTSGDVTLDVGGTITLSGPDSSGIVAQSVAGYGGEGGTTDIDVVSFASTGGSAGDGGTVSVTNTASITSLGDGSTALAAQSIGGGGGNGGDAFSVFYSSAGSGSLGGNGSTVTVVNSGDFTISGNDSHGILAHSTGGAGGNGGLGDSGAVALGGGGGSASNGGAVTVTNSGAIITGHDDGAKISSSDPVCGIGCSYGILAYSIGGGGGSAGSTGASVSLGGASGKGGDGGATTVANTGSLQTNLVSSPGLAALSIGGGGGSAHGTGGLVVIGGSGGSGGDGSTATINHSESAIETLNDDSDGAIVQSIGGGGGHGSNAVSASVDVSVAIGGTGGDGGNGQAAVFDDGGDTSYTVTTTGDRSRGVFAQSAGGGGGSGGYDVSATASIGLDVSLGMSGGGSKGGDAGTATASVAGDIVTNGSHAMGVFAQSQGGGGGNAGMDVTVSAGAAIASMSLSLGGSGGDGGDSDAVDVTSTGDITTAGDHSTALVAASQAGGGGNAGITLAGTALSAGQLSISLGGDGGGGGDAGAVTVTTGGNSIQTSNTASRGIFAQSAGGGGGNADVTAAVDGDTAISLDFAIGGGGGDGGGAAAVTVTADSQISTLGDHADGIKAQSIGGGGGNGAATISGEIASGGDFALAVGGDGGGSGDGSSVSVTSSGAISTAGDNSFGLLAQSISKGGGSGGLAVSGDLVSLGNVTIGVAGSGGTGGIGGDVTASSTGKITTAGDNSTAILAASIGGGGGSGGASIAASALSIGSVKVSVGGDGGTGGQGGTISVTNTATLKTGGTFSTGLQAQSIGGAGGNGGFSATGGIVEGEISGDVSVTNGGDGGSGGTGGNVAISNAGKVSTNDFGSRGIFGQSVGGSGGDGGMAFSATVATGSYGTIDISDTTGGEGGDGGQAGTVDVSNADKVETSGFQSNAIQAQSVGGNGGAGGTSYALLVTGTQSLSIGVTTSTGGSGGSGAIGNDVSVENSGELVTKNGGSDGIHIQSVGGNGGDGGISGTIVLGADFGSSASADININSSVGGNGGSGSDAGTVAVANTGKIVTKGNSSRGVYAQSVGGGGGDGGTASAFSLAVTAPTNDATEGESVDVAVTWAVGGDGGAAGDGDTAEVTNSGKIKTSGAASYGIYAQSVGGGGGNGGDGELGIDAFTSNEIANEIFDTVGELYSLYEAYKDKEGQLLEWEVAVGGSEGAQGDGNTVGVHNSGAISTTGHSGTAIFATSVGGGGGSGGDGVGGFLTKITAGGAGSGGGDGGGVNVTNTSNLSTTGEGAMGIFAQSVGGGGGAAGDVELGFAYSFYDLSFGAGVATQEDAGNGGDGGAVDITSWRGVTTTGKFSHGIWAQSVGGSGGAAGLGDDISVRFAGFSGSAGDEGTGGAVSVGNVGAINVSGFGSVGIFAQSVGGGASTDSSSKASDVSIKTYNDVISSGENGRAIMAQSEGGDGNGSIGILVGPGATVSTAENGYETIGFLDGKNNTLTNYGTIKKPEEDGLNGYVVIADGGLLDIENYGILSGSILLDDSYKNILTNAAQGTFEAGQEVNIGSKETPVFTNAGIVSPGGSGTIITTDISSDYTQSDTGTLAVDLDLAESSNDALVIAGNADIAGSVTVNLLDVGSASTVPGTQIIAVASELNNTAQAVSTAVGTYSLSVSGDALNLDYTLDFSGDQALVNAGQNRSGMADHLQRGFIEIPNSGLLTQSQGEFKEVLRQLANLPDSQQYAVALDTLSPQIYADSVTTTLLSLGQFHNNMMNCEGLRVTTDTQAEGRCGWMSILGYNTSRDAGSNSLGYDEQVAGVAGGLQVSLDNDWTVGAGLSYINKTTTVDNLARSEGNQIQGGLVFKRIAGNNLFSASISAGQGNYDVSRSIFDGSTAKGQQDISFVSGVLRGARTYDQRGWYLRPSVDLGFGYLRSSGLTESGAGAANITLQEDSQAYANIRPALEAGGEVTLQNGYLFRPKISVGLTYFLNDTTTVLAASFEGMSGSSSNFLTDSDYDNTHLDVSAGFDLLNSNGMILSVGGFGQFSDSIQSYGGAVKLEIRF